MNISEIKSLRHPNGLLQNVNYEFLPDGRVNYRSLLQKEHLYFNKEKKDKLIETYGKHYEKIPINEIDDKYLLITLAGIKYLAEIRGYLSVQPRIEHVSEQRCVVTTNITWIPNFETNYQPVSYGQCASASIFNTFGWEQNYMEAIAANRSFVRAVRFFLGLSIVGYDEIGFKNGVGEKSSQRDDANELSLSPTSFLEKKVAELGLTFEQYKIAVIKKYSGKLSSPPQNWESFSDISIPDALFLLDSINKQQTQSSNK